MFSKILMILIILLSYNIINAQRIKPQKRSEVIITFRDSTIKADVRLHSKKIKIDNDKVYYWYAYNSISKNMGGFYGKLLDGSYSVFNKENKLIVTGSFCNGIRTGIWKRWNSKGGLVSIENFKKGRLSGECLYYNEGGDTLTTFRYKKGIIDGISCISTNDTVIKQKYNNGKIVLRKKREKNLDIDKEKNNSSKVNDDENLNENTSKEKRNFSIRAFFRKKNENDKELNNNSEIEKE